MSMKNKKALCFSTGIAISIMERFEKEVRTWNLKERTQ